MNCACADTCTCIVMYACSVHVFMYCVICTCIYMCTVKCMYAGVWVSVSLCVNIMHVHTADVTETCRYLNRRMAVVLLNRPLKNVIRTLMPYM